MYVVNSELPADRKMRRERNKTRVTNFGKRWNRIKEKIKARLKKLH